MDNNFAENWQATLTQIPDNAAAAVARVFLCTPTNWVNVSSMLAGHVVIPFSVLLARPCIILNSYAMCTCLQLYPICA